MSMMKIRTARKNLMKFYEENNTTGIVNCYDEFIAHFDGTKYPPDVAVGLRRILDQFRELRNRAEAGEYDNPKTEIDKFEKLADELSYDVFLPWLAIVSKGAPFIWPKGGDA